MYVRRISGVGMGDIDAQIASVKPACSMWDKFVSPQYCATGVPVTGGFTTAVADLYSESAYGDVPMPAVSAIAPAVVNVPATSTGTDTGQPVVLGQSAGTVNSPQMQGQAETAAIQAAEDAGTYTPSGDLLSDWVDLTSGALSIGSFLTKYWWIPAIAIGGVALIAYSKK